MKSEITFKTDQENFGPVNLAINILIAIKALNF